MTDKAFEELYKNNPFLKDLGAVYEMQDRTKEECFICGSTFQAAYQSKALPCKHKFHKLCLEHWLKKSQTCPLCRKPCGPNN